MIRKSMRDASISSTSSLSFGRAMFVNSRAGRRTVMIGHLAVLMTFNRIRRRALLHATASNDAIIRRIMTYRDWRWKQTGQRERKNSIGSDAN